MVLITTDSKARREDFQRTAKAKGAADLLTPAEIMVVDKLPLLGSGKPDYVAVQALAVARAALAAGDTVKEPAVA